jgi:Tfp pilus assembly PilM family ATPase
MPGFGKNITVGLELSGSVLRAVQVQHRQGRPRLLAIGAQELSDSSLNALTDQSPVWKVVRSGRRPGRLVVNVPGSAVVVRKIQVEDSEMNHLRDWVMWEIQQYLPGPSEEYFIDFQKLRTHQESGLWQVLVVLARRETVRERAHLFRSIDLRPAIIDVDPLALQNAFELNYPSAVDFPVALINLERDFTTLVATRGRVPEGISTISTPLESEELCQEIHASLGTLLQRVTADEEEERRFSKILISGGGPHLEAVVSFLSSHDGSEVELADPFRELTILPALMEQLDQSYRASEFMLATGLALR